jgi:xanthine dehydrogenase small subunit
MAGIVRYWLDGAVREARAPDPTLTLLEHLRGDLRRTGTKEGCAEGDCGACTVLVGEREGAPEDEEVAWRAVNACIVFLPMIDGKALITVESLAHDGLNATQRALVDHHGSQCGFCTPGIVMALHGRAIGARGGDAPIEEVLAGNLCRCTGYGPIIAAARATPPEAPPDVAGALRALRREAMLDLEHRDTLSGVTRRWLAPRTGDELADAALAHPDAVFVAGATDVGLWVTKQHRALETMISLGEVADLKAIEETPGALRLGAGVRYADALPALARLAPDLGAMVRRLGSTQVRNSGTIGGNIANGSPIGDMAPALIALGATLHLRWGAERRDLPLEAFFLAYGRQDRRPGEFVEAVIVPRPPPGQTIRIFKLSKRFDQDISAVCGAFALTLQDGAVAAARVAFGGMAATPRRAGACEAALIGRPWTRETVEAAARALVEDFQPISDLRASAAYRALAAANLLRKVFAETAGPPAATRVLEITDHG